jgi:hypothetical protein
MNGNSGEDDNVHDFVLKNMQNIYNKNKMLNKC